MKTNPIIYEEIKDYFKLDSEGRLWNLLTGSGRYGKKGEWRPCYQNKPHKLTGYLVVRLKGTFYLQHRIIYCLYTKRDVPTNMQIDHVNGITHDNNIDNLRLVNHRGNQQNRSEHRGGGLVGANYSKQTNKWLARIKLATGREVSLGYFPTEQEANQRYIKALELINLSKEEIQKHFGVAQHVPSSQYKGVSWYKASSKWSARIRVNGKLKHLGYFKEEKEAHQAYLAAKKL